MHVNNANRNTLIIPAAAALVLLFLRTPAAQTPSPAASDEAVIKQLVANFMSSWNRHDAHAMCTSLAEDGDFVSWRGERFHGRKEFEDYHASLFAGLYKDTHRTDDVRNIRFLTPEIASVDDYWSMTGAKTRDGVDWPYREGLYNFLMTKQQSRWIVVITHAADFNISHSSSAAPR